MTPTMELTDPDYAEARLIAIRVARRYLPDGGGEAEDVAQSVLLRLLTAQPVRDWRPWVNRVARNLAIDRARQTRPILHDALLDDSAPPRSLIEAGPSARGMWPQIWRHLTAALNDRERQMLLASLDGASATDLAADFGYASANSATVTLHRIRSKVKSSCADRSAVLDLLGEQRIY